METNTYKQALTIITDLIESCGGSTKLIRYLNRLGICSSLDTLSRVIQQHVKMREHKGPEQELCSSAMIIVSADNIDFLHKYAHNFCGRQSTSWHGTTVQIVQPRPSLPLVCPSDITSTTPRPVVDEVESLTSSLQLVTPSSGSTTGPLCPLENTTKTVNKVLTQGTKRGKPSPYPSPNKSCRSPVPKIQRRARSGAESACIHVNLATELANESTSVQSLALSAWRHLEMSSFEVSSKEMKSVEKLQESLCTYQLTKQVFNQYEKGDKSEVLLDLHQFLISHPSSSQEKSEVVYLQALDAIADRKDTLILVLNDLHARFIKNKQMKHLLVEGDAKLYDVLQSLKFEYGVEYSWLIPMLGDWHLLKNYQIALMKPYFECSVVVNSIGHQYNTLMCTYK